MALLSSSSQDTKTIAYFLNKAITPRTNCQSTWATGSITDSSLKRPYSVLVSGVENLDLLGVSSYLCGFSWALQKSPMFLVGKNGRKDCFE